MKTILLLVLTLFSGHGVFAQAVQSQPAGKVQFFNQADSDFDRFTLNPDAHQQRWMQDHYQRMLVYTPYFDSRLAWYANGLVYVDSYAIYENSDLAKAHPEWILHDAQGRKLYIPWNCQHGRCDQYAGDFSNPAFKTYMIEKMRGILANGYKGLWLDDVNLAWRVSDGQGNTVQPIDSQTGTTMTLTAWQGYFADYMAAIRAAFPNEEIAHNALWHADTEHLENPLIRRQIQAADYINLERGGTDAGLVDGNAAFGFETFLRYIDYVHQLGSQVIMMDYGSSETDREYGLAAYLLTNQGRDLLASNQLAWTAPNAWWLGYGLNLGEAIGARYEWQGLLRRDFQCGSVVLNQPNRAERNAKLSEAYATLAGTAVTEVILAKKTAQVLLKPCAQH